MSGNWIDPGSLEGDALTHWYLRSPAEIDQMRQAAAARRYRDATGRPVRPIYYDPKDFM